MCQPMVDNFSLCWDVQSSGTKSVWDYLVLVLSLTQAAYLSLLLMRYKSMLLLFSVRT